MIVAFILLILFILSVSAAASALCADGSNHSLDAATLRHHQSISKKMWQH